MKTINEVVSHEAELIEIRRKLHAHPELGYEEFMTSDLVAQKLLEYNIPIVRGMGKTGVVGTIRGRGGNSKKAIGLRADMDALPLTEANMFDHKSQHPGRMHACGHDGHTTMLLGAAKYLAEHNDFDGTVHLIFQPAEEGVGAGARAMINDGLFQQFPCDAVFGMHNQPGIAAGQFGVRPGGIMASNSNFRITVKGKGAHAAMPHDGNDPLFTAVQIISALQSIITRNKKPIDTAVLSITQFHGGTASNIIADEVWFGGTVRTFSPDLINFIENRIGTLARGISSAFGCEAIFEFERSYPATVNNSEQTAIALEVMRELVGSDKVDANVEPAMGAEDFAFMLIEVPGCYVFIGNGASDGVHRDHGHGIGPCMLHNPSYDFNDAILTTGVSYWARLVHHWFSRQPGY